MTSVVTLFHRPLRQIGLGILIGLVIAVDLPQGDYVGSVALYDCERRAEVVEGWTDP